MAKAGTGGTDDVARQGEVEGAEPPARAMAMDVAAEGSPATAGGELAVRDVDGPPPPLLLPLLPLPSSS